METVEDKEYIYDTYLDEKDVKDMNMGVSESPGEESEEEKTGRRKRGK